MTHSSSAEVPTPPRPRTVRALTQDVYGGTDVLQLTELPAPPPGPGEVLLDVHAAGIDRGTLHLMTGLPLMARLEAGLRRPRRRVLGLDVAGRVAAVGPGVTRLHVGQEVFGTARGSLAQQAVAKESTLAPAPPELTPAEAAVLGVSGLTALQALDAARVGDGDHVLVLGASGGVGSLTVKLAVARGARVTAVCSAAKAADVRSWGAERVLDHAADPLADVSACDAVVDIAGGTGLRPMRHALRMLPARQRYVMILSRETHVDLERLAEVVTTQGLRPHVHATPPLAQAPGALDDLAAGRVTGKVAVLVAEQAGRPR